MITNCIQSVVKITCKNSYEKSNGKETLILANDSNYNNTFKPFFQLYNITFPLPLYKVLKNKLIYNIPNKCNGIERWLSLQQDLVIDCNNINCNYLNHCNHKLLIRLPIPPTDSKIVSYYSLNESNRIINKNYIGLYHYKLYYTKTCTLVTSNNYSYSHKKNYELGILIMFVIIILIIILFITKLILLMMISLTTLMI